MDIRRKSSLYLPLGSVNLVLKAMGIPDEISSPPGWNRVSPGCPRNFNTKLTEPTRQINTTFPMNMIHPFICILLTHLFTLVTWWSMYTFLLQTYSEWHENLRQDTFIYSFISILWRSHSYLCDMMVHEYILIEDMSHWLTHSFSSVISFILTWDTVSLICGKWYSTTFWYDFVSIPVYVYI